MSTQSLENVISKEEKEKIIKMYQDNISLREISNQTKHSRNAISKMLEKSDIKTTKGNHY